MTTATHGADALTARLGSLEELVWLYDQTSPFHFVMGATFVGVGTAARWREVLDALATEAPASAGEHRTRRQRLSEIRQRWNGAHSAADE